MLNFTFLDSLIIIFYLIIVLSLGLYHAGKRDKNVDDYFLGGKNLGWLAIGLSIFATNISSEHFIGLAGSGAFHGLVVGQFELMAIFILVILGWFLAPIYIKSGVITTPEFLEKRFDRRSRKFFASLSIIIYILTKITVTLFAGGILFERIFGINIYASTMVIVLITGIYTVLGGATSVIKTSVFQAVILIFGAVTLTIFGLHSVGGFAGLEEKLPAHYFTMFKSVSDHDFPWTGIIFGAPIIAFWYWATDQYFVSKILGAKSIDHARRGALLAALLKVLPIFMLVLPGLIAIVLFPEIKGDEAYPVLLAGNLLPSGVKGFVLAGLLAAIMSSLSAVFNTTASLMTNDFYKPRNPNASDRELVLIGRLSTVLIVVTAILCIPLVKLISNQVYLFLQEMQSFVSPPIAAVFAFAFLMKKATASGAMWTFIIGEILGVSRLILGILVRAGIATDPFSIYVTGISFLHFAVFLFLVSSFTMVLVSLLSPENKNLKLRSIQYLIPDCLNDIKIDFSNLSSIRGFRTNIAMSVFIFLIIISLWSIWY